MSDVELKKVANEVRKGIVTGVHAAKSGHPGGSLGAADIMYGLGRGCTKFKATGMYSGAEKPVIMVIVSRRELNTLKTIVRERDPRAIVTVADVTETFGEGFKDISA